ncbi:MAG: polysaccharide deacetylase family protein, partial [Colwellia sp.]
FHAIGSSQDGDWADPHYSFKKKCFNEFLSKSGGVTSLYGAINGESDNDIIVTFDDGHISNYFAAKYMHDNNYGNADFFISPEKVGQPHYMNWQQIKHLSDLGMSIQSHGLDHRYLSDCSDDELQRQLVESKRIIESYTGKAVTILAPPGGRYDNSTIKMAKLAGYQCIANSEPGKIVDLGAYCLPRIAVLNNLSVELLLSVTSNLSSLIIKQKIKYTILALIKALLGNTRYEKVRWKILGSEG